MAEKQLIPLVWDTGAMSAVDAETGRLVVASNADRETLSRKALTILHDAPTIVGPEQLQLVDHH